MSNLDSLWELQEIRKKYLALKRQEQAAVGSAEVRELEGQLKAVQQRNDIAAQRIKDLEKDLKKKELDCQELEQKKSGLQQELYGGKANPKELSNLQQILEKTESELSAVEDNMMQYSEEMEALQKTVEGLKEEISQLESSLAVLKANIVVELQGVRHEMAEVKGAHGTAMRNIDKKTLDLYDRKFKQFSVTAVAKVNGGLCTGCKVHLPRYLIAEVKKREGLVGCENCGRILYYPLNPELSS